MTPYHADPWLTVYQGDCREVMAQMEPESVHCVVTSPPYWGLRDYGTATWLGGADGCDHRAPPTGGPNPERYTPGGGEMFRQANDKTYDGTCRKCGAVRQDSQLGLEPTPEQYVENMVAVFREVRRVLRKDGTCWVNLGDSYNSAASNNWNSAKDARRSEERDADPHPRQKHILGLKHKDLVGIPWRVAFALQADGWYLRSDIIWSKPNPMPESVTDRPTKAHEYLFLLTKSPRYYYDADAVREAGKPGNGGRLADADRNWDGRDDGTVPGKGEAHSSGTRTGGNLSRAYAGVDWSTEGRNLRTVWTIATQPYPGAHFATFPEALVEPCVKAGTSERGVCPECGAPWVRESVASFDAQGRTTNGPRSTERRHESPGRGVRMVKSVETTGWRNGCAQGLKCYGGSPMPATVLDPFAGSGTTGRVAQRLNRRAVLIDLSGEYLTQTMKRNADIPLGLETA